MQTRRFEDLLKKIPESFYGDKNNLDALLTINADLFWNDFVKLQNQNDKSTISKSYTLLADGLKSNERLSTYFVLENRGNIQGLMVNITEVLLKENQQYFESEEGKELSKLLLSSAGNWPKEATYEPKQAIPQQTTKDELISKKPVQKLSSTHAKLQTSGLPLKEKNILNENVEPDSVIYGRLTSNHPFSELTSLLLENKIPNDVSAANDEIRIRIKKIEDNIKTYENPENLQLPVKPIPQGSDPVAPSQTITRPKNLGTNYDALGSNPVDEYEEIPNVKYYEEDKQHQKDLIIREQQVKENTNAENDYQIAIKQYRREIEKNQKNNKETLEGLSSEKQVLTGLQNKLRGAISIPGWQKVKDDFDRHFQNHTNESIQNIRTQLLSINEVNEHDSIRKFSYLIIDQYKILTNPTFYSTSAEESAAKDLRDYCNANLGIKMEDEVKSRLDVKFTDKYNLMVNKPDDQGSYTITPSIAEFKLALQTITDSINIFDWSSQTVFGYSRPDGINEIDNIIKKFELEDIETRESLESVLNKIQTKVKERLDKSSLTRTDVTTDFYKSLVLINTKDKFTLSRVEHNIEVFNRHLGPVKQNKKSQ